MAKPGKSGVARIVAAFGYSIQGLRSCWRTEAAFRLEVLATILMLPLALYLGDSNVEKALLVAALMLVLVVEVINSSIEAVVDRVGSEFHALSGMAKDLGSSAVLLSLINAGLVWAIILFL